MILKINSVLKEFAYVILDTVNQKVFVFNNAEINKSVPKNVNVFVKKKDFMEKFVRNVYGFKILFILKKKVEVIPNQQ